jgi:ankyrin repeat protein
MARDKTGLTPLHGASFNGHVDVAQLLVKHNVDVTAQDKDGSTPLHFVSRSRRGNVDLARLLIEHGSDATSKDKLGLTPLDQAKLKDHNELVQFLVEHSVNLNTTALPLPVPQTP